MIQDPYQVLGISNTATDDEVKKAYRELSRKYHPDSYVNNPLADLAEEKFKEVQEAYDMIIKQRQSGYTGSSNTYGGQSYTGSTPELNEVAAMIQTGRYQDAVTRLASMQDRPALWFYLSAIANYNLGNQMIAIEHARTAATMDPSNPQYQQLLNQMSYGNQRYNAAGAGYGRGGSDLGDMCCNLWIADTCCECMGGDLCSCM